MQLRYFAQRVSIAVTKSDTLSSTKGEYCRFTKGDKFASYLVVTVIIEGQKQFVIYMTYF